MGVNVVTVGGEMVFKRDWSGCGTFISVVVCTLLICIAVRLLESVAE
jgi:hypothetical protein